MINPKDLLLYVIRPTLKQIALPDRRAEKLLLGTGLCESGLDRLDQGDPATPGPALSIYQMERFTHDDLWARHLDFHPSQKASIESLVAPFPSDRFLQLAGNLYYATAMCRIKYLIAPEPLPAFDDMMGFAMYWKKWYNTKAGKGTPKDFMDRASVLNHTDIWST